MEIPEDEISEFAYQQLTTNNKEFKLFLHYLKNFCEYYMIAHGKNPNNNLDVLAFWDSFNNRPLSYLKSEINLHLKYGIRYLKEKAQLDHWRAYEANNRANLEVNRRVKDHYERRKQERENATRR